MSPASNPLISREMIMAAKDEGEIVKWVMRANPSMACGSKATNDKLIITVGLECS